MKSIMIFLLLVAPVGAVYNFQGAEDSNQITSNLEVENSYVSEGYNKKPACDCPIVDYAIKLNSGERKQKYTRPESKRKYNPLRGVRQAFKRLQVLLDSGKFSLDVAVQETKFNEELEFTDKVPEDIQKWVLEKCAEWIETHCNESESSRDSPPDNHKNDYHSEQERSTGNQKPDSKQAGEKNSSSSLVVDTNGKANRHRRDPIDVITFPTDTTIILRPARYGVDNIMVTVNGVRQEPLHGGEYFIRLGANERIAVYL